MRNNVEEPTIISKSRIFIKEIIKWTCEFFLDWVYVSLDFLIQSLAASAELIDTQVRKSGTWKLNHILWLSTALQNKIGEGVLCYVIYVRV